MIKQFTLGAQKYKVKEVDQLGDLLGYSNSATGSIAVASTFKGENIPEVKKEQTLYHEVVHAILDELGMHELSANEEFVQGFSLLLHQFEKTKK